jgi:hypothetical protein
MYYNYARVHQTLRLIPAMMDHHSFNSDFTRPAKPVEHAFIEALNVRLRDECLNVHQFTSTEDARPRSKRGAPMTISAVHTARSATRRRTKYARQRQESPAAEAAFVQRGLSRCGTNVTDIPRRQALR